jgi:hypothetical protein
MMSFFLVVLFLSTVATFAAVALEEFFHRIENK